MVLARKKAVGAEYDFLYQEALPQKPKRIVVQRQKEAFPYYQLVAGLLLLSCFFTTALAYTFVKARLTCLNWELKQIEMKNAALFTDLEKMKLEIAEAKSLQRIKNLALNDLGMVENPGVEYLVFSQLYSEEPLATMDVLQVAEGLDQKGIIKTIYEAFAFFSEKIGWHLG